MGPATDYLSDPSPPSYSAMIPPQAPSTAPVDSDSPGLLAFRDLLRAALETQRRECGRASFIMRPPSSVRWPPVALGSILEEPEPEPEPAPEPVPQIRMRRVSRRAGGSLDLISEELEPGSMQVEAETFVPLPAPALPPTGTASLEQISSTSAGNIFTGTPAPASSQSVVPPHTELDLRLRRTQRIFSVHHATLLHQLPHSLSFGFKFTSACSTPAGSGTTQIGAMHKRKRARRDDEDAVEGRTHAKRQRVVPHVRFAENLNADRGRSRTWRAHRVVVDRPKKLRRGGLQCLNVFLKMDARYRKFQHRVRSTLS
ncbi:hypothetical protein B0H10DRAFT_1976251 [Mycena sp. CBHHK59/15]|nr:hypothetical protein B0H10DRAFT_1976251 [Mycena sp. CBHHK59/15]